MRLLSQRSADFVVVIVLALFVCWYSWDAYQASSTAENLILITPITLISLILCILELTRQRLDNKKQCKPEPGSNSHDDLKSVLPIIGLFAVYVLSLETIGFDIATTLFVGCFLLIQKERRLVWIIGYSVVFGLLMSTFFAQMLPYPMPMTLLHTDY
ncbi:tripartite tricarboxylate transporter TctB family protein [Photobacterium sp. 2_MG-2023]|uniref:Tripartite tricarboxylate transporter TctB family protein n=1 Tax=Photobacterium arenosum TaxID=2774143 RepID=A0ABR9BNI4_9GAMM|nr:MULTISPECIES: tripartite tricarboxylate transporter TctB family protein [Photobacterium]MBD8514135.1 tripartite tricarboxylate transporter TctB family protein [Photobacterium arenosum]MDO6580201.1 tripartite tricarboxylate transporter TctB family protein [Photobacterium sp. 2_MG-2023]